MNASPCLILLATAALATASPTHAQDSKRPLTPWDVASLQAVSSAEISPDGGHVAYVVSVPRKPGIDEDGTSRRQLHVLDLESGESRPYVTAESGVSGVAWTPDSASITFLAKREGDEQRSLYSIPVEGGEAERVFAFDDRGVGSYQYTPDGTRIAILATAPVPEDQKSAEKKGFRPEVYEESWRPGEVWLASPDDTSTEPKQVLVGGHVVAMEWAPDGRRLAVAVTPTALVDHSYTEKRLWVVDTLEGTVTGKVQNGGKLGMFAWSPDGTSLALIAAHDEHDGSDARLQWGSAAGEAAPKPLLGERERDENWVQWLGKDRLIVRGSAGGWTTLDTYRIDGSTAVERRPIVPLEGPAWTQVSVSADGRRLALVGSTPEHPPELYTLELGSGSLQRRTNHNPWLAEVQLGKQEIIRYAARDGLEVEGILMHPVDGSGPAPLLVAVHGGPEAHLSNGWLTRYSYPGQIATGRGYAVFYPNYRGSTGRGLGYLKASQGDPAGKEFDDVVDGVDYLIAEGIADGDRVGVTGGSYGGYATAWFSSYYSERFAAGVMFVGISNKISKVGTTDIADEEFLVHAMKRPWDDWQFFLERSPIFYADRGQTPLLILHGKNDTRVDPGQSREMYRHLKLRGKAPVRLVNYPGEGHGNRKAGAQFDYCLRMLRWFDHYLLGEGGEPPAWPVDYSEHQPSEE